MPKNTRLDLFDSFADMISAIPIQAVLRTLERELSMVEQDMSCKRPVPLAQAVSILFFCRFIEAIKKGISLQFIAISFPVSHLEFYRKTMGRLVNARQLSSDVFDQFERNFEPSSS